MLGTLNIISFSEESFYIGSGHYFEYNGLHYTGLSVNPVLLLILCLYIIVNYKVVSDLYKRLFTPTELESKLKFETEFSFYYDKFQTCDSTDFSIILKNYAEYTESAKAAIDKICIERDVKVI